MGKKSTPLEKAARMLDLVPYISSHQGISLSELAQEFAVSEDELLSDLNSLWMCGDNRFDLMDLQFESGFVSIRNAQTLSVVRSLSQQEIVSILIGLNLIEKALPTNRSELFSDIKSLREKLGESFSRILEAIPVHSDEILATVQEAIAKNRKLQISYYSPAEDEITERVVAPLELYVSDNKDFLSAFCDLAESQRTFRVDRIKTAKLLELPATNKSLAKDVDDQLHTEIQIVRNHRQAREALGSFVSGDGAEISVSSYSPEWLLRTVMSAAGSMKVLAPIETQRQIATHAAETLNQYR